MGEGAGMGGSPRPGPRVDSRTSRTSVGGWRTPGVPAYELELAPAAVDPGGGKEGESTMTVFRTAAAESGVACGAPKGRRGC